MNYAPERPLTITAGRRPAAAPRLRRLFRPGQQHLDTPEHILSIIALTLNMNPACYKAKRRLRDVAELRHIAALLLRDCFPHITLREIATHFGGMDHSSIISGICRATDLISNGDEQFTSKYYRARNAVEIWLRKEAA
jgi:chromosomal replication initiation ATPase DnaA